ncbi:CDP-glycerol glycerophosphotransferase family protein [Candidatus Saccharibacteria bacterium]|nr:CDP-glycerol glycerophosphotransferase family protein [Candidatus Saccharibacteria bacterium]
MSNPISAVAKKMLYNSSIFLSNKKIILESSPDYNDSSRKIYEELLRRHINDKYKIYWFVSNKKNLSEPIPKVKNVHFVNHFSLHGRLVQLTSKYIIDSNVFVGKLRKKQLRLFLDHGMALKMAYDYAKHIGKWDYGILTSDYFIPSHIKLYGGTKSNYKICGYPRNDGLLNDVHVKAADDDKKYIIWMPTYRNHRNPNGIQTGINFPFGMPCIENKKQLRELNDHLAKNNTILVFRPHPAEDLSRFSSIKLSNIILFNDSIFAKTPQLYESLKDTDALITDYSSIYYDYLLLKKPIGLSIPDLKEYTASYELAEDDFKGFMKGEYIETFDDLIRFVSDVAKGKKMFGKDMVWAMKRYNKYLDGNSSKRIVDLIEKEMKKDK